MLELKLILALSAILILPGLALVLVGPWRTDPFWQRLSLSLAVSVVFWPVLFYGARLVPGFVLGFPAILIILSGSGALIVTRIHHTQWTFAGSDWWLLAVLGGALMSRFYIIQAEPYPAWSDSLHHVLLTQLTAETGRLPFTLAPYVPEVKLDQYHLGLYALSGSVQMLSGAPAHTALLWTAQVLNAGAGLGVFYVLDRWVGRTGAILGAMVVSFWSFQPAWYVNWGRFTQLSSQFVLPFSWVITFELLRGLSSSKSQLAWFLGLSALLNAGLFELHFRVAILYAPLIVISVLMLTRLTRLFWQLSLQLCVASGLLALPALWPSILVYVSRTTQTIVEQGSASAAQIRTVYFDFPLQVFWSIGLQPWLTALTLAAVVFGLWRRQRLTGVVSVWVISLMLIGNAYLLGIRLLNVTNFSAIVIMLYLPASLFIGSAAELMLHQLGRWQPWVLRVGAVLAVLISLYTGRARATEKEILRYFVTPADVQAMAWIRQNTPATAVFGINTVFWLPHAPHGTDAGYWLPYLAGRKTTAGVMINDLGNPDYISKTVALSQAVLQLPEQTAFEQLRRSGVTYLYIGAKGNPLGPGLDINTLRHLPQTQVVYEVDGVVVLALR